MARKTQQSRTGSIGKPYQRKDGTWGVVIRWFDARGRRESEAVTIKGPNDRLTAQRRLDTHLRRAEEERVGLRHPERPPLPTFSEMAMTVIEEDLPSRQSESSQADTIAKLAVWEDLIGTRPIDELTSHTIAMTLRTIERSSSKKKRLKPATCNRYLAAASVVFAGAVERELIPANPCCRTGLRRTEKQKLPRFLHPDEALKLLKAADKDGHWASYFAVMLYAGPRVSELGAVRRRDVDLRAGVLRLNRTKSGHERSVPIAAELRPYLERMNLKPGEYLLFVGRQGSGRRPGDPMKHQISRPEKALRRSLKKAGIERKITPHDLRHTFATISVMHGVPLSTLQAWLGHSTLRMTERYVHALRSNDDQWIDKLRFGRREDGTSA